MTIKNIRFSRVLLAMTFTFITALILYFMASCVTTPFMPTEMSERFNAILERYIDAFQNNGDVTMDDVTDDIEALRDDYATELYVQYIIQWSTGVLAAFWFARWAAKIAISERQAVGYGVVVGVMVAFSYGILCVMLNIFAIFLLRLVFFALLIAAGYAGGKFASLTIDPNLAASQPTWGRTPSAPGAFSAPPTGDASIYYNMGVTAAMGGRREEARQHFGRVLQYEPRNIAAWLQLANLADSPVHAWEYIEQARAINPADPSVVQAVNMIWPQVQGQVQQRPAPPNQVPQSQPPYRGGVMDDTGIPRSTLPDVSAPGEIVPPDEAGTDDDPPH